LAARLNLIHGTAEAVEEDGQVVGVGGIRYMGIGEGWFITVPEKRRLALFEFIQEHFQRVRTEKNLWRIFAESKISERFLHHLGFVKNPGMHIYTERRPNGNER
jgi:hypothetical protein